MKSITETTAIADIATLGDSSGMLRVVIYNTTNKTQNQIDSYMDTMNKTRRTAIAWEWCEEFDNDRYVIGYLPKDWKKTSDFRTVDKWQPYC